VFLTPEELHQLTNRRRRDAQLLALRSMGIEHRRRPDGSLAVLKAHVEHVFSGGHAHAASQPKSAEPNWAAM
jgi:hypothetical protein